VLSVTTFWSFLREFSPLWGLRWWNRVRWSSEFIETACLLDRSSARRHIFGAERMDLNASVEIAQLEAFQDPCFLG
jgi:hypothetical protein